MNISGVLIVSEHSIEKVDWHLLSSARFTLFVCVLNNKTKEGQQQCTTDDGIVTAVTISSSPSVFLMARSLVLNQLESKESSCTVCMHYQKWWNGRNAKRGRSYSSTSSNDQHVVWNSMYMLLKTGGRWKKDDGSSLCKQSIVVYSL
jgi:hypothetical protein